MNVRLVEQMTCLVRENKNACSLQYQCIDSEVVEMLVMSS